MLDKLAIYLVASSMADILDM